MLRCEACRRIITQAEADEAAEIHEHGTYCPECATAFAEGEDATNTAGDPS